MATTARQRSIKLALRPVSRDQNECVTYCAETFHSSWTRSQSVVILTFQDILNSFESTCFILFSKSLETFPNRKKNYYKFLENLN